MEEVYIYAMATSPRRNGNTEQLLDQVIAGAREAGVRVLKDHLDHKRINPCLGCNWCGVTGQCIQQDGMQEVYPHLLSASGIILAAPIFSMHICAQAKMIIDRCQRFWSVKYVLGKQVVEDESFRARRNGLFISVCGRNKPDTFECVRPTIAYFYHVLEIKNWSELEIPGVDEKGEILRYPDRLEEAHDMGRSMALKINETL